MWPRILILGAAGYIAYRLFAAKPRGLGLADNSNRPIEDGAQYNAYFPKPDHQLITLEPRTSIDNSLKLISKTIKDYAWQTKPIAKILQAHDTYQTLRNVFFFTFNHIRYKLDDPGTEQIRTPARTWNDRKNGVDCDCFTVFIGTILENLNIPYVKRVTAYGKRNYQHIYIVAYDGDREVPLDPVIQVFDYEKPYTYKKDYD